MRYLHTMIRVRDIDAVLRFFCHLYTLDGGQCAHLATASRWPRDVGHVA